MTYAPYITFRVEKSSSLQIPLWLMQYTKANMLKDATMPHLPTSVQIRKKGLPQKSLAKVVRVYPRYLADIKT
jgi:hypothetical protein